MPMADKSQRNDRGRESALYRLRTSEIKYRTLFDNANDGIFLMKRDSFIDCNKKFLTLFGCSKEQIIGETPYKFSPPFQPDGRVSKEKAIEKGKAAVAGVPQSFEWKHCRYDGSLFDAEVSLNRIEIDEDTVLLQAIIRDISERKEAENRLRASEERYRTFVDSTSDAVFLKDENFRYLIVNKAFRSLQGKREEEIIGKTNADLSPRKTEKRRETDMEALRSSSIIIWEEAFGEKIYEIRKFPVTIASNIRGIGGYMRDITARKRAEEEVKVKSLNLEEVNAALRVLLKQREQDKVEVEDRILANMKRLVLPYFEKLKKQRLNEQQMVYVDILETNLTNIVSPFVQKVSVAYAQPHPVGILVANLIRDGKTVKEIAKVFSLSEDTVNRHRQNIRNKLGLNKKKASLKSYLMSLN